MRIFHHTKEIISFISKTKKKNITVGFVPTMGALHQGHLSLVDKALTECDTVVVSIFVNPTQFDNSKDLKKYPRTLEADVALLQTLDKSILVFAPNAEDVYNGDIKAQHFSFDGLEHQMEGKQRKGHFDGVGTIVKRLFEIVTPDRAYFGEKDYQQLQIIKTLVRKSKLPIKIVGCPIKREPHGLAMSSRNERLTVQHRREASFIYKTLLEAKKKFVKSSATIVKDWVINEFNKNPLLELEYVEIANTKNLKTVKRKNQNQKYRIFIAVYAGEIRLIDNIALN